MAVYVKCPQCKERIPFGRLFCTFCGAKLELSAETVTNRITGREFFTDAKKMVLRLVWTALVFGAIALFFWPMPPLGQAGNDAQGKVCEQKIASVRARVLNGVTIFPAESFTEPEANAWLKGRVAKLADAGAGLGFQLSEVNLKFSKDVVVVNTRLTFKVVNLSYEIELQPTINNAGFQKSIRSVRIGHVPMPDFTHEFLSERALHVFADLREEQEVVKKLKQLSVAPGQITLTNQGR